MGGLTRPQERIVACMTASFICLNRLLWENMRQEGFHGIEKMKFCTGVAAALIAASAGVADAQQSEILFSHKHWEVSVVGWDDGSVGCVAEVKA
ncbi:MAG: hypothetical protein EOP02_28605, partial [Proteobacteria bacterium]